MRVATHRNYKSGGERGIRTPEARFRRLHTFQACSFNHSDTSPDLPAAFRRLSGPQILAVAAIYCEYLLNDRCGSVMRAADRGPGDPSWHNVGMSYLVLARKWRPKRFAELVGQEHVV